MRYSRTGIIIALVGAEIFIAGAILAALGGHGNWAFGSTGMHTVSFAPRTFDPIDAGSTPHVQIDDADSTVTVSVSSDGLVHVWDNTRFGGAIFAKNSPPQLQVERTPDGARIYRPSGDNDWFNLGWSDRKISVAVPANATLEIVSCAGADISGLNGSIRAHSDDGDVSARDLRGDADLSSDDGGIAVAGMNARSLSVSTSDGDVNLRDIQVDSLDGSTNDGDITASGLKVAGGSLKTSDGSVEVALGGTNLLVHAHTDDGSVSFDGRKVSTSDDDDDSSSGDYKMGSGGGTLEVASNDGNIHISTNGVQ